MKLLLEQRKGGNVKRFHTMTMLREHLVSSHSWGVALNVIHIHPQCSASLLKAALWHDVPEYETGDIAAPTKWKHPSLANEVKRIEKDVMESLGIDIKIMPFEQEILKTADMGDLILSCIEEYQLGNQEGLVIAKRGINYLLTKEPEFENVVKFIDDLAYYVGSFE